MSRPARPLSRRALLRSTAFAGVGSALLAACGGTDPAAAPDGGQDDGGATGDGPSPAASETQVDMQQEIVDAIRAAGFGDAAPDWTVIVATFEVNSGPGRRLQFGLLDETQTPAADREVEVAIVRSGDLEVVQEVSNPIFHGEGLGIRGVYAIETDIPEPEVHYLVVASEGHVGAAPMVVRSPENSQVIQTGQAFPAIATPTVDDEMGLDQLCTRDPDCTMHDVSLDEALASGKPVVVTISTPQYCQTAICGPVVDVVEDVKQEAGEDIVFIHNEVFSDAGNTPTELVTTLNLPSEPWTFLIASDGTVADRFDGPVVPSLLRDAVSQLS